jgi:hypothetical protein
MMALGCAWGAHEADDLDASHDFVVRTVSELSKTLL